MNENKFEQLLLDRLDKIDNRFDKIDTRLVRMDDRITVIESRFGNVEQTTAWIKGNLQSRAETRHTLLSSISLFVAIFAFVIVILI